MIIVFVAGLALTGVGVWGLWGALVACVVLGASTMVYAVVSEVAGTTAATS